MNRGKYHYLPFLLCLPIGLLACVAFYYAFGLPRIYREILAAEPSYARPFESEAVGGLFNAVSILCWVCWPIWLVACILGAFRTRVSLFAIRGAYLVVYLMVVVYAYVVWRITGIMGQQALPFDGLPLDVVEAFKLGWHYVWPALLAALLIAGLHVVSLRAESISFYTGRKAPTRALGDRIIENIRMHGRDRTYRTSSAHSVFWHVLVIIVLPWLLAARGCVEPYLLPPGSGTPAVALVRLVKPRPRKKKRKFILRRDSAIIWEIPDLDESDIPEQVDRDTRLTYTHSALAQVGRMGAGGGKTGGWPGGVPGGKIRFIRLEYRGEDWDDGMDARTRADVNFLNAFRRQVPFKVARKGEANEIHLLDNYPKGYAPPFVYMTGSNRIYVSRSDMKILREYLLRGGMLFADCGGERWDRNFRYFVRALLPGKRLINIADDDEVFQIPYSFPNGAPPLWHHGGTRALGVKHNGRWMVFYHPGDLNDAWKTGYGEPEKADRAVQMGINVIYHAVTNYLRLTVKHRK